MPVCPLCHCAADIRCVHRPMGWKPPVKEVTRVVVRKEQHEVHYHHHHHYTSTGNHEAPPAYSPPAIPEYKPVPPPPGPGQVFSTVQHTIKLLGPQCGHYTVDPSCEHCGAFRW
ncbi:hypothetical protein ABEB36_007584 [Hypothenemus hampei]|uniref:Uncharacterized protein n=1 Tax=Hypothenemus hampei TaxID=57062 RepID=A0ABD1EUH3_HYPHA